MLPWGLHGVILGPESFCHNVMDRSGISERTAIPQAFDAGEPVASDGGQARAGGDALNLREESAKLFSGASGGLKPPCRRAQPPRRWPQGD